ncbi:MAG: Spy/CpxP family protein refolding chaperone [Proteobacteria bacterium]|nr:Spy/CpxP family protein refolding chaperone [Pseudomonadota bacterium]
MKLPHALAAVLTLAAPVAFADDAHHPAGAAQPPSPAAPAPSASQGMGMMPMMHMMMTHGARLDHIEGRLAFLKAELKITDGQLPYWNVFADAMRSQAKAMGSGPMAMPSGAPQTAPGRLDTEEHHLTASLNAVRALKATVQPLYAVLEAAQKQTFDQLALHPMGMAMM